MDKIKTKGDAAFACEVTAIGALRAAEVARDALSRVASTAKRRANQMRAALIKYRTEVDDCSGVSYLCRSTMQPVVYNHLGTFMYTFNEDCCATVMSLGCNNERNVERAVKAVHRQLPSLCDSVHVVCARPQLLSVTDPLESVTGAADHGTPPAPRFSVRVVQ